MKKKSSMQEIIDSTVAENMSVSEKRNNLSASSSAEMNKPVSYAGVLKGPVIVVKNDDDENKTQPNKQQIKVARASTCKDSTV